MSKKPWFEVDRQGLAEIVERRGGKAWLIQELISNAWDETGVTAVTVKLDPHEGSPMVDLSVVDDSPTGFADLAHAWTLFAKSAKRTDVSKRGRFNLGEKLVLAFCKEASITTTTGSVIFDHRGRTVGRTKRDHGSEFFGVVRMTRKELDQARTDLRRLIPPSNIVTTIDGEILASREPLVTFSAYLWTEVPDDETGALCRRHAWCDVRLFQPLDGEVPMLYELGIPVVALDGDPLHVDVRQKVPLNLERDNVTPSYLRDLRSEVLNHAHDKLDAAALGGSWATDAMAAYNTSKDAIDAALTSRFGKERAAADPSDREAENLLKSRGMTIVHGGSLPKEVWSRVRDLGLVPAAGQIAPTPKPYHDGAPEVAIVPHEEQTPVMRIGVRFYRAVCRVLLGREIQIVLASEPHWPVAAVWHRGRNSMLVNVGKLPDWHFTDEAAMIELALHEIAHEKEDNHLCEAYHEEICRLAGKLYSSRDAIEKQIDMYRTENGAYSPTPFVTDGEDQAVAS